MLGTAFVVDDRGRPRREPDASGAGMKEDEDVVVVVAFPVESVPVGDSPGRSIVTGFVGRPTFEVREENRGRIWFRFGRPRLKDGRDGRCVETEVESDDS